jgi:hypothetical protein
MVHAKPVSGAFQPAFAADSLTEWRATLSAFHARGDAPLGATLELGGALSVAHSHFDAAARAGDAAWSGRISATAEIQRPFAGDRLVLGTVAAAALGPDVAAQDLVYFGGPMTGPGYGFHEFAGVAGVSQRVEWRHPAWTIPVPLGRFGPLGMPVTLAPFVQGIWMGTNGANQAASAGWHESAGLGILSLWDALRFDVARGLRGGRWTFAVDFSRDFWRIL